MMAELSLGISPCPNDIFTFSGLILKEVEFESASLRIEYLDIESLNEKAQGHDLDIVKISYANYSRCAGEYNLLSAGGALGRGVGPLLLSNDGDWKKDAQVMVPGLYTTANFLLDFWAQEKLDKKFVQFDSLYKQLLEVPGTQGVVIHEKRFTYAQDGLHLIQDLGTYWEEQTGYPIPLGALLAKKNLPAENITAAIRKSLLWAYEHHDEAFALCQKYAADLTPTVIQSHIDLYVNEFSLDLGDVGKEAVAFFFERQKAFLKENAQALL